MKKRADFFLTPVGGARIRTEDFTSLHDLLTKVRESTLSRRVGEIKAKRSDVSFLLK